MTQVNLWYSKEENDIVAVVGALEVGSPAICFDGSKEVGYLNADNVQELCMDFETNCPPLYLFTLFGGTLNKVPGDRELVHSFAVDE